MKLNDKTKRLIHLAFGIAVSVILAVVGILFICSCYSIYKSGSSPFTRQSIGEAFRRIAVPVYLLISVVIIGAGIDAIIMKDEKKLKAHTSLSVQVERLASRVDLDTLPLELSSKILKERRLRTVLSRVRFALVVLSAFLPLIYLLNPANFPAVSGEYNAEILHGMLLYLVFLLPVALFEVAFVIVRDLSLAKESEALKEGVKLVGRSDVQITKIPTKLDMAKDFFKENSKQITLGVRIALVGCAVVFIVAGIINGGMSDVLNKAIKICTECIGLG